VNKKDSNRDSKEERRYGPSITSNKQGLINSNLFLLGYLLIRKVNPSWASASVLIVNIIK
jgi:hypothetical protein